MVTDEKRRSCVYLDQYYAIDLGVVTIALDELYPDLASADLALFSLVQDGVSFYGELDVLIMGNTTTNLENMS